MGGIYYQYSNSLIFVCYYSLSESRLQAPSDRLFSQAHIAPRMTSLVLLFPAGKSDAPAVDLSPYRRGGEAASAGDAPAYPVPDQCPPAADLKSCVLPPTPPSVPRFHSIAADFGFQDGYAALPPPSSHGRKESSFQLCFFFFQHSVFLLQIYDRLLCGSSSHSYIL